MIELEKVRVVFFDFDDTLCIHSIHEDLDYKIIKGVTYKIFDKIGCRVNKQMFNFIKQLKRSNIEMHLISATGDKDRVALKLEWVLKRYGVDMTNSCVEHHVDKITKIKEYCDSQGLNYNEALYIDDMYQNLDSATKIGIQTCSPMEVVNYMNDKE